MPKVRIPLSEPLTMRIDAEDEADIEAEERETGVTKSNIIRRDIKAHRRELALQRGFRYSQLVSNEGTDVLAATG